MSYSLMSLKSTHTTGRSTGNGQGKQSTSLFSSHPTSSILAHIMANHTQILHSEQEVELFRRQGCAQCRSREVEHEAIGRQQRLGKYDVQRVSSPKTWPHLWWLFTSLKLSTLTLTPLPCLIPTMAMLLHIVTSEQVCCVLVCQIVASEPVWMAFSLPSSYQ